MDIEAKLRAGKGKGFERWAQVFNVKEAAKRAFDAWPEKPIPKTAQLSEEFTDLIKEKKACYSEYRAAKKEMIEYQNAKQNVDRLLNMAEPEKQKTKER